MTYIWINPVTEHMYQVSTLEAFLERHGLTRVRCRGDWGAVVREKYRIRAGETEGTVVDARCPMACNLARELTQGSAPEGIPGNFHIPDIEPILIHCAREISAREDLKGSPKLITTPCRALAEAGNALELADTRFLTWNGLMESVGEILPGDPPEDSPIPPGFFDSLGLEMNSLTGRGPLEAYIRAGGRDKARLAELMYCENGCHNGDGVVRNG